MADAGVSKLRWYSRVVVYMDTCIMEVTAEGPGVGGRCGECGSQSTSAGGWFFQVQVQ